MVITGPPTIKTFFQAHFCIFLVPRFAALQLDNVTPGGSPELYFTIIEQILYFIINFSIIYYNTPAVLTNSDGAHDKTTEGIRLRLSLIYNPFPVPIA